MIENIGLNEVWVQNGMNGVHKMSGECIAITEGKNRLSNAKLIAAAPYLLEACQKALIELEQYIPISDVAVIDLLQVAINKALS